MQEEYTFDELVLKIQRKAVMSEGRSKTQQRHRYFEKENVNFLGR